jgi:hypothetical protein
METYDFYYGTQVAEFERPEIPDIIAKKGIKANIAGSKYTLTINPSKTEVVILNVRD